MQNNESFRESISINLGITNQESYDTNKTLKKQSLWRVWKRLSSLQRTVIVLVLVLCGISAVYILPNILQQRPDASDLMSANQMRLRPADILGRKELDALPVDKHNNIEDLRKMAKEQLDSIMKAKRESDNAVAAHMAQDAPDQQQQQVLPVPGERGEGDEEPVPGGRGDGDEEEQQGQLEPPVNRESAIVYDYFSPDRKHSYQQQAIIQAFKDAWSAYRTYAWGHDEFHPLTKKHSEWFGVGLTILDSIDTIVIMGLKEEFEQAREFVKNDLTFDKEQDVNLFEITIRVLGGLLSVYHLTGDDLFKIKAKDLGDRLLPCFDSPSGVPFSDINLKTGKAHAPRWGPDSSTSEVSTIQLEFRDLSYTTGDDRYEKAVDAVSRHLHSQPKKDGLVPIFINAQTGKLRASATISVGARGDSYYEYLLKQWIQTGKTVDMYKDDYLEAVEGMKKHLLKKSEPSKLTYLGELINGRSFSPKMDHLVCFMGGALALGHHHGLPADHLALGRELTDTCYQMYERMPTKLSPEIVYFNQASGVKEDLIVKALDAHNLLRPETVESIFVLYRLTGEEKYRDWGWKIFQAFQKHTKIDGLGYSSINNVKNAGSPGFRDKLESFFLAETLKYLYLLFSDDDDLIPLDKFVFNSEAHPLPILKS